MAAVFVVATGMLLGLGAVTTALVSADEAHAHMNPLFPGGQTLGAFRIRWKSDLHLVEVATFALAQ